MPRYRVLAGTHSDFSADGKFSNMIYKRGDTVLTKSDLGKLNSAGKEDKFQLIPGSEEEVPPVLPFSEQVHSVTDYNAWLEKQKKAKLAPPAAAPTPVTPVTPVKPKHSSEELHKLNVTQLRDLAEEEEIELAGASTKEKIIEAILKAQ